MACCREITMSVVAGGCPGGSGGNDPAPNDLLINQIVSKGFCTTPIANLGTDSGFIPWDTATIPVGNYFVNYISGNMPFLDPTLNSQGRATGRYGGFNEVGSAIIFGSLTLPGSFSGTLVGFACTHIPAADCTGPEIAVIVANTLAANPVANFLVVDSATFGLEGGNVASVVGQTVITETALGAFCPGGGSITWELIQTQRVQEQPACVKIKDYAAVAAVWGICAGVATGIQYCTTFPGRCPNPTSEWTGTFPFRRVAFPNAANRQVQFFPIDYSLITSTNQFFTINGQAMATVSNTDTVIAFRVVAGIPFWQLIVSAYNDPVDGSIKRIWSGTKNTGTDPIGEYTYDPTDGPCAAGPATICIEACP